MRLLWYVLGSLPIVTTLHSDSQIGHSPNDRTKTTVHLPVDSLLEDGQIVPDRYIVTLKQNAGTPEISEHLNWVSGTHRRRLEARRWTEDHRQTEKGREKLPGSGTKHKGVEKVWTENFKGYSGEFDQETIQEIAARHDVSVISDRIASNHNANA